MTPLRNNAVNLYNPGREPRSPAEKELYAEVVQGMIHSPEKFLSSKHLYSSAHAMILYGHVANHPAYYPTNAEDELLTEKRMEPVLRRLANGQTWRMVSFGPGSGNKDLTLLDLMICGKNIPIIYHPVDVCETACEAVCTMAEEMIKSAGLLTFDKRSFGKEFISGLRDSNDPEFPRFVYYPGGTFGNFGPGENLEHLKSIAAELTPADYLLISCDMMCGGKTISMIEDAYRTPPTVEWVMYLLEWLNANLRTKFSRKDFTYRSNFDRALGGVRTELVANHVIRIDIPGTRKTIFFKKGEALRIEISMKYFNHDIRQLFSAAGFTTVEVVENYKKGWNKYLLRKMIPERGC